MRRQRYNHDKLKVVGKRRFGGDTPYSNLEDPFISWVNYDQDYEWSNTFPYESPFWNWNWNYISQNAPQPLLPSQISPIKGMTEQPELPQSIIPQETKNKLKFEAPDLSLKSGSEIITSSGTMFNPSNKLHVASLGKADVLAPLKESMKLPTEITVPKVDATKGNWFNKLGAKAGEAFKSGALNDTMVAAGDLVYKGLTGDKNVGTGVGNTMSKLGDIPLAAFGPWGAVAQGALKVLGGLSNAAFGSTYNYENINAFKKDTAEANANTATLSDYDSIMNNNWNHARYANKSYFGKDGWFTNRVGKMARRLNTISGRAQDRERLAQAVSIEQVGMNTMKGLERQWYAEGGDLQSPRTAIDAPLVNRLYMNKATNNVRRAANALGLPVMSNPYLNTPYAYGGKVNRLDGTEDSWLLGGVGIAADRTGKPLGYMVQENYDPSSYEYNALGKEADQYISKRFPMNHIPILIGLEKNEW